jgi:hypothetical protein
MTDAFASSIACNDNSLAALREASFLGARLTAYQSGKIAAQRDVENINLERELEAMGTSVLSGMILIDTIEKFDSVATTGFRDVFNNTNRGILGIRMVNGHHVKDVHASEMVATNFDFIDVVEAFISTLGLEPRRALEQLEFSSIQSRMFSFRPSDRTLTQLYRGALPQKKNPLTKSEIAGMASSLAGWFIQNMSPEGELPYKIYPSNPAQQDRQNNTIRQLMATVCIRRYAELVDCDELRDCARRNLAFNLRSFYREVGNIGTIAFNGSAKLGASAMAALAIYEQEGLKGPHAHEFDMLLRGIDILWCDDGSFRTFHFPAGRNDNQNFYPGEALCLWARLLEDKMDSTLLKRFLKSFRHYRDYHRANPNPAFVPWHTMAYYAVWKLTGDVELADFIFEMNDWLLDMQQIKTAPCPDFVGRFYNPDRPDFGPPHASSTAVYLEGLIDAYSIALQYGRDKQSHNYLSAIDYGIRNLQSLLYDGLLSDIFSASYTRHSGLVKTNPYDNTTRIDNIQHAIAAITKILKLRLLPA